MPQILERAPNLEVHKVADGYLIYQENRDKVSYLNHSAATVFEFCDCALEREEIVRRATQLFGLDGAAEVEIPACVESLIEEGLVRSSGI